MKKMASMLVMGCFCLCSSGAMAATVTYSTLAGSAGAIVKSVDGSGSAAQFYLPRGITRDGSGNLYVADSSNHTIRKISSAGDVTTLAGSPGNPGYANGSGSTSRFTEPFALVSDSSGTLYVADTSNHAIRKITTSGGISSVTTLAGGGGSGSSDGSGSGARFWEPRGIALGSDGTLYVADYGNHTIRRVDTSSGAVTTMAGLAGSQGNSDSTDGTGATARFKSPSGIAVDSALNIYVADTANRSIRKITPAGIVSTLNLSGAPLATTLNEPRALTVDSSGTVLYVTDYSSHVIRRITTTGAASIFAGIAGRPGSVDGTGLSAKFYNPSGITVDTSGVLSVADSSNCTIRTVTSTGVVATLAGTAGRSSSLDATTGSAARFEDPYSVAVDGFGNVYVADATDHTIRKITTGGVVTTLAGVAGSLGSTDGTGSGARFFSPMGITANNSGTVYVSDTGNKTIRRITIDGVVTTLAGAANLGGSSDAPIGTDARFSSPEGIAVDNAGNLYVADTDNNSIRRISPTGTVSTLAGAVGPPGLVNGIGTAARFAVPFDVAVDQDGTNVYVCDHGNHVIRKIVTATGEVTTLAGSGTAGGSDGTGTAASFRFPSGVAVDSAGNVFVADTDNQVIRKITSGGVVSTIGGKHAPGSVDGLGTAASFYNPKDVTVDSSGNLYIADRSNHTIRKGSILSWTISATVTGGNGTVDCTPTVSTGDTATCTVTPTGGYQLGTFTDNSLDTLSSVAGNSYIMTNVTTNHTITATFSQIPANGTATIKIGASSGTIKPLLGENAGPLAAGTRVSAEFTSQYKAIGVRSVRTHDQLIYSE